MSRFSGPWSNFMLNTLKNSKNIFQSKHSILHTHQQYMRIPISPHPVVLLLLFSKPHGAASQLADPKSPSGD